MNTIVITGSAGFIGSCLLQRLKEEGYSKIIVVDDFSNAIKMKNLENKPYIEKINRNEFFLWIEKNYSSIDFIVHIGARTDTTETNWDVLNELNLTYSKKIWQQAVRYRIPIIYASSAATYGLGEHGYKDNHEIIEQLQPLNLYCISKNEFDKWVLQQKERPPFWAGLKFFNVYGPNEYHKNRMASVIFHAYHQINKSGKVKLFSSHNKNYKDGEQLRDFVYVKDVINTIVFLIKNQPSSGIYNLGTGQARTFNDLAIAVFKAMNKKITIEYIDTPIDIRDKYQYFTEVDMNKLRGIGYDTPFSSLEDGITDYVKNYLIPNKYL